MHRNLERSALTACAAVKGAIIGGLRLRPPRSRCAGTRSNASSMKNEESSRQRLLEINRQQAEFYEHDLYVQRDRQSLPVRIWGAVRDSLHRFRQETGIGSAADELHQVWLGDLAGSKVLDLGVGCGNALSIDIARRCRDYHAIDLSERLAASFQQALLAEGLQHARSYRADFLADDFAERDFDIIYALGVAHHFEDFDLFLATAQQRLKPGGRMITYDPLNTFWASRLLRAMFRPFQNDAAWEWPFARRNFELIVRRFRIAAVQGTLGRSKWAFPLVVLSPQWAIRRGRRAHLRDLAECNRIAPPLFRCLHVTMCLVRE